MFIASLTKYILLINSKNCINLLIIILGVYQWKFVILKEHKGNEGSCIGISKYPIKDQNYRTTSDMWLYRAYK